MSMCYLIFDCVSLGFECKTEAKRIFTFHVRLNDTCPFYCMNSQNEKSEKDIYLKQNGTAPSPLRFPSSTPRATTSPMRITTIHSVHLPFFIKYFFNPAIITFLAGYVNRVLG